MANEIGALNILASHTKAEALPLNQNFASVKTKHNDLVARLALSVDDNGFILAKSSADSEAPNGSIYYSTDASKLVYKDGAGTVNNLY